MQSLSYADSYEKAFGGVLTANRRAKAIHIPTVETMTAISHKPVKRIPIYNRMKFYGTAQQFLKWTESLRGVEAMSL